jgi:hypothetical protein
MVDFQNYYKTESGAQYKTSHVPAGLALQDMDCSCEACTVAAQKGSTRKMKFSTWDDVDPAKTKTMDDDFFTVCSRDVPAFLLQDRKWGEHNSSIGVFIYSMQLQMMLDRELRLGHCGY